MSGNSPIHLDGTTLEGGGQLLRLALSLSSLTHLPVRVTDIRGKRGPISTPGSAGGLKPAHLAGAKWLAGATTAATQGMEWKSKELTFRPKRTGGSFVHDDDIESSEQSGVWKDVYEGERLVRRDSSIPVSTPGSIPLVLQAILPYLLYGPASHVREEEEPVPLRITIQGGTNVSKSPSIEYISQVLLPTLSKKLGIPPITTTLRKRGWSTGTSVVGNVIFDVPPLPQDSVLPAFRFSDRGTLTKVHVSILAPTAKAQNLIRDNVIAHALAYEPEVEILFPVNEDSKHDKRFYLLVVAETSNGYLLGRDWLYDLKTKGIEIEETCKKLVSKVMTDLKQELKHRGCVDEFMQDQLVVFQAFAAGKATIHTGKQMASLHTKTARWVVEKILGIKFDDTGDCEGVKFLAGEDYSRRTNEVEDATEAVSDMSIEDALYSRVQ